MNTRKSQAGVGLKELIATLVVAGILLMIGVVVFAQVKTAVTPIDLSSTASSTVTQIESTTYSAFNLATVALVVLAAAVIIGILIQAFGA